jgi:uncharacterized protein (TIGR03066 family)
MKVFGCVLLVGVGLVLTGCGGRTGNEPVASRRTSAHSDAAANAEPVDAKKIVGIWELVKGDEDQSAPKGTRFEFDKDGKFKVWPAGAKAPEPKTLGTYKVEGNKLILTQAPIGIESHTTYTVLSLTDTTLVRRSPGAIEEEFKRVK